MFILGFASCEDCEKHAGKEQVSVIQSIAVIDSIKIDQSLIFKERNSEVAKIYSTGWTNITNNVLKVIVYSGSVITELTFELQQDRYHYIHIYDISEDLCSKIDQSKYDWQTFTENNVQVCFYTRKVECP